MTDFFFWIFLVTVMTWPITPYRLDVALRDTIYVCIWVGLANIVKVLQMDKRFTVCWYLVNVRGNSYVCLPWGLLKCRNIFYKKFKIYNFFLVIVSWLWLPTCECEKHTFVSSFNVVHNIFVWICGMYVNGEKTLQSRIVDLS